MLRPIRILSERDKSAMWSIFEYMANQPDRIVSGYRKELQVMAEVLDLSEEKYEKETGLQWEVEEYEGDDLDD